MAAFWQKSKPFAALGRTRIGLHFRLNAPFGFLWPNSNAGLSITPLCHYATQQRLQSIQPMLRVPGTAPRISPICAARPKSFRRWLPSHSFFGATALPQCNKRLQNHSPCCKIGFWTPIIKQGTPRRNCFSKCGWSSAPSAVVFATFIMPLYRSSAISFARSAWRRNGPN